jgi:hypothetical protein
LFEEENSRKNITPNQTTKQPTIQQQISYFSTNAEFVPNSSSNLLNPPVRTNLEKTASITQLVIL